MASEIFQNCVNVFKDCCSQKCWFLIVLTIVADVLSIVAEEKKRLLSFKISSFFGFFYIRMENSRKPPEKTC